MARPVRVSSPLFTELRGRCVLRSSPRTRKGLLPYPVRNPGSAEVVQEAGAPHRGYVRIGQPAPRSGRGGHLGYPARMAHGVWRFQVYEICDGAQGDLELCL